MAKRRCKGKTKAGKRCHAWALHGSDRCGAHPDSGRTPKKARARKAEDWRPRFLACFEEHVTVIEACRAASVARSTVYEERARSEQFAAAWAEVEERTTERMEREALRRGVEGWIEREEFAVGEEGERTLTLQVRKFSDTLLIFMLKARRPGVYRENVRLEHSGPDGGPIAAEITTVGAKEVADAAHDFLARIAGPSA